MIAERNKMIKAPQVRVGTEEMGMIVPADGCQCFGVGVGVEDKDLPVEAVATDFADDTEPFVGVISERTGRTQFVEIPEGTRAKIDVAEHACHFESRRQLTPGVPVPGVVGPVRKNVRRFGCGRGHCEEARRSRSDTEITGRDRICGLSSFIAGCFASVLLLRTERQSEKSAHCHDCTPLAHCILHYRNYKSHQFLASSLHRVQLKRSMATQDNTQQTTCFSKMGAVLHQSC